MTSSEPTPPGISSTVLSRSVKWAEYGLSAEPDSRVLGGMAFKNRADGNAQRSTIIYGDIY